MNPYFSIILSSYNRQELLSQAVSSVLAQTDDDWELIVVDDASPSPLHVVDDPRIHLLRNEENSGKSAAVNRALRCASGEIVAFLDDDDLWEPLRLEHAREAHALADVAVCGVAGIDEGELPRSKSTTLKMIKQRRLDEIEMPGSMCATSVRREVCPAFDESFRACEDLEWGIRLLNGGSSVVAIASADFIHRRHDGIRHLNGQAERMKASERLLTVHVSHYDRYPRKRAYRLYRIAAMAREAGEVDKARSFVLRSITCRPSLRALRLLVRMVLASTS